MPRVAQCEHLGRPVSHYLHADEVLDLPHVAHVERRRQRVLDRLNPVEALARNDEIDHVDEDVYQPVHRVAPCVEARVHLGPDWPHSLELFVELDAPQAPGLLFSHTELG